MSVAADHIPDPGVPTLLLVGREREQQVLHACLESLVAGRGGLVLIGGEAGVGKTVLSEALSYEARIRGALVLVGRCYELSNTPLYGPWIDLFRWYPTVEGFPQPPAAFARQSAENLTGRASLGHQLLDVLRAVSEQQPLMLVLEDLHWADLASLDLIRIVTRDVAAQRLLVLMTFRSDEIGRDDHLYHLLPVMERETHAERLELRRFQAGELRELIDSHYWLTERETMRLVEYLLERTGGNPFFATQLLRVLEEHGELVPEGDQWVLGDLSQEQLPLRLRQIIDGRFLRLSEEDQALVELASVIGREVSLAQWATIAGISEDRLLSTAEALVATRLAETSPDGGEIRFIHALAREAIYEGILPLRRQRSHRRVAEVLAELPAPDPDAVAYHFRQAADVRAARWLVEAGERAERAHALLTAAERFESAVALMDAQGSDPSTRGWLHLRVAILRRNQDPERPLIHITEALRLAEEAGDQDLTAYAQICRGMVRWLESPILEALADLEAGVAAVEQLEQRPTPPRTVEETIAAIANRGRLMACLAYSGRLADAKAAGKCYLSGAVPAATSQTGVARDAVAWTALAYIHAMQGQVDKMCHATSAALSAYQTLEAHDSITPPLPPEVGHMLLAYLADDRTKLEQLVAHADQLFLRSGVIPPFDLPSDCAHFPWFPLLLVEGRWQELRRAIDAISEDADVTAGAPSLFKDVRNSVLGELARAEGDTAGAWHVVHDIWPAGPTGDSATILALFASMAQRLAAALCLDAGNLEAARAWLEAHDRRLDWMDATLGRSEGHLLWARFEQQAGNTGAAVRHAEQALASANQPRQPLALLSAHRLLGTLYAAKQQYDKAAAKLGEALALAAACRAPYERALTLLELAGLRHAEGNPDAVPGLLDEVRDICAPLKAGPALRRAEALAAPAASAHPRAPRYPAGLTKRELQVLNLLAAGRSTKEVASELFVSDRTVERYITTAYRKIGVRRRAEAVAFAIQHGLEQFEPL